MPRHSIKRKSIKRKSIKRKSIKRKSIKRRSIKRKSTKRRTGRADGSKGSKRKHELISSSETPDDSPIEKLKKRMIEKYDRKDMKGEMASYEDSDEFAEMDKFVDYIQKGLRDSPSVYICPGTKQNLEESILNKMIIGSSEEKEYCWAYNYNTKTKVDYSKEKWDNLKVGSLCIFGEVVDNDVKLFNKGAFVKQKINFQNKENWPYRRHKDWRYGFLLTDPFNIQITKEWMDENKIKSDDTPVDYNRTQRRADSESARKIKEKIKLQY